MCPECELNVQKEYIQNTVPFICSLPDLQCTAPFTSEAGSENSRDQTDNVNQKTTKRHALRCGLRQSSSPLSTPLPEVKHARFPLEFSCQLLKRNGRRWGEGDREIKKRKRERKNR